MREKVYIVRERANIYMCGVVCVCVRMYVGCVLVKNKMHAQVSSSWDVFVYVCVRERKRERECMCVVCW